MKDNPDIPYANNIIFKNLLIYGFPGSGKTTLANSLAGEAIDRYGKKRVNARISESGDMFSLLSRSLLPVPINILFCIDSDAIIHTLYGDKILGEINESDIILTAQGWSSVSNINFYNQKVIQLIFDKGSIICTPDHEILTTIGWKQARFINRSHIVLGYDISKYEQRTTSLLRWNNRWRRKFISSKAEKYIEKENLSPGSDTTFKYKQRNVGYNKVLDRSWNYFKQDAQSKSKIKRLLWLDMECQGSRNSIRKDTTLFNNKEKTSGIIDRISSYRKTITMVPSIFGTSVGYLYRTKEIKCKRYRLLRTLSAGTKKVVDITTMSGNFIANGIIVHNCDNTTLVKQDKDVLMRYFRLRNIFSEEWNIRNGYILSILSLHRFHAIPIELRSCIDGLIIRDISLNPYDKVVLESFIDDNELYAFIKECSDTRISKDRLMNYSIFIGRTMKGIVEILPNKRYFFKPPYSLIEILKLERGEIDGV